MKKVDLKIIKKSIDGIKKEYEQKIKELGDLYADVLEDMNIYEMSNYKDSTCSCRNCVDSGGYLPCGHNVKYIATAKDVPIITHINVYKNDAVVNYADVDEDEDNEFIDGEMFAAPDIDSLISIILG